jgi:S-adenosylhomocysteine hydrolase
MNDDIAETKFDNVHGCCCTLPDGIKLATDMMIVDKLAHVRGYADVREPPRCATQLQRTPLCDRPDWRTTGQQEGLPGGDE